MEIRYDVTGERRKTMVDIVSKTIDEKAVYMRMPTCAYKIGGFQVSKEGTLTYDEGREQTLAGTVLEELKRAGFEAAEAAQEAQDAALEEALSNTAESSPATQNESQGLTVSVPLTKVSTENLTKLLEAKGSLIKKALAVDSLPIEIGEESVSFPWFSTLPGPEEVKAYTHLISAICEMSRGLKRITAKEKAVDNERYAFRCFLLRLGFIGAEFKDERKILLRNLSGNSAFKSGAKHTGEDLRPEPPNAAVGVVVEGDPALAEALADAMLIEQVNAGFTGDEEP